jgi:multiple sugar transport system substrate-binding protein
MSIDPTQPIPLYFQLKTLLLEEILGGRYGPDDRLPTEHELCEWYAISRTPVSRALSELAEEGVILRHRRRGTFVNPHWLRRRPDQPEVRVVVSEGPWGQLLVDAATDEVHVNLVTVPLPSLHQALTHAVAEGQAPDLAILDSVWIAEFAADGFLLPLEDLDGGWVRKEHESDFLEPLVKANRFEGHTYGISPFANVAGLWYRRRELEALGLPPPRTWAELRAVGRAAVENGVSQPSGMTAGWKGGESTA